MSWTDDPTGGNGAPGPGEGGGPSGSGNPTNNPAPVDAVVVEYGRLVDLVSEGPISGLVNGLKSVFLDETPIQNSDLTMNFRGLNVVGVKGTNTQAFLSGFPSVESEASVNTQVTTGSAVVRSITTSGANAARVKIRIPALQNINATSGQATGTSVIIAIDVQNNGGGFATQVLANSGVIGGQFDTPFTRAFRVSLPGTGPWDIRVRRITADSGSAYLQNDTWFDSLTAIVDSKLRYPNSALFGLVVDAKQFRSIPARAYEIKGRIISVPTNYDPVARTYATSGAGTTGGVWDGTFKQAWTNNPAWVWYDMATSGRYGAGSWLDASKIDKYALYTIAQYCDVSVSDGKGGTEPRFTCNAYIQTRQEGIKLLNDLASVFRGMTYWAEGTVVPVQDVDASPAAVFTAANVEDGGFTYSGTALKARHTAALVTWNDPANGYRQAKEYVEDAAGIARYGLNVAEITAFGCTSQAQARRAGVHLITSELTQPETVVFRAGLDGTVVLPGDIILVQDPFRAAQRFGGRAAAGATTTVVPLDSSVTLAPATSYQLSVAMPDGTVATRAISTGAGTVSSLTLGAALPSAPAAGSIWVISVVGAMSLWRVVSISEVEPTKYEITALAHNPSKYATIDSTTVTEPTPSPTPTQLAPVTGLSASYSLQVLKDQLRSTLKASWTGTANATGYIAEYSEDYKPWVRMEVSGLMAQAWIAPGATYRVRVLANYEMGTSPFVEATVAVPVPTAVASDLSDVLSDDVLSRSEKPTFVQLVRDILQEQVTRDAQASALGVSATAYDASVTDLMAYLNALPAVRTNILKESNTFSTSPWTKGTGDTLTSAAVAAPDGATTGWKLTPSTTNTYHYVAQTQSRTASTSYARTIHAKPAGYSGLMIQVKTLDGVFRNAKFDLAAGTVYSSSGCTAKIATAADGWFRLEIDFGSQTGAAAGNDAYLVGPIGSSAGSSFAGDGTSGVYIWEAMDEPSASATSIIHTDATAVTEGGWSDHTADTSLGTGGGLILRAKLNTYFAARQALDTSIQGRQNQGWIQSPNYAAGTSSVAPVGVKINGTPFTVTLLGGATMSAQGEFGDNISIGGHKAAVILNKALGGKATYTSVGTTSWTCPDGVTEVEVTVVAGGGGGGAGHNSVGGGGGGGGAAVRRKVAVTPGVSYTVTVGGGGIAGATDGANGGDGGNSVFGSLTVNGGKGGKGGSNSTAGGNGGDGATATTSSGASATGGTGATGATAAAAGTAATVPIAKGFFVVDLAQGGGAGGGGAYLATGRNGGASSGTDDFAGGSGSGSTSTRCDGGGGGASAAGPGGVGARGDNLAPTAATAGTKGSGGGGGGWNNVAGAIVAAAAGGNGFVEITW